MAGADLGTLTAKLQLNTTGAEESIKKLAGMFGPIGIAASALAATFVGVGAIAVDMAVKFQSATDLMAASAGITQMQAKLIGDAFLGTAFKSTFSAQTMMAAYAPVSGQLKLVQGHALDAGDALLFMTTSGNLAEATGQPLAEITAALARVMLAYHISVAGAATASDILFNVSGALNVPVSTLATSFANLGFKLGPLAPSLQDVGTLLLDLGEHKGPSSGRGLLLVSSAFNTLLGNSKSANAEIAATHLHVFTATGAFVGMASIIAQLAPKLAKMTEQHRLLAEKELFGAGASKALDATIMAGLPGWGQAAKAADTLGTAHKGAMTATDNLKGAFDRMKGGIADLLIKIGTGFMPVLTGMVNFFDKNVLPQLKRFSDWIIVTAIPDLVKFGGWVTTNVITPLLHIAQVVIPILLGAMSFVVGHISDIMVVAKPLAALLATMWAVNKIASWASAAKSALGGVLAMIPGLGASGAAGAAGLAVQKVWIVGSDIPMGGGVPLPPSLGGPKPATVGTGLLGGGGAAVLGIGAGLTFLQVQAGLANLAAIKTATDKAGAMMKTLADVTAVTGPLTITQERQFLKLWQSGVTSVSKIAADLSPVVAANDIMQTMIGKTPQQIGDGFILLENQLAGVTGNFGAAASAVDYLARYIEKVGPVTADQMLAFKDDVEHGVTSAFDIWLSLQTVNANLQPGIQSASDISAALKALHKSIPGTINLPGGGQGSVKATAGGGFFDRPTRLLVGEAGPEAVLNRAQFQAMMNGGPSPGTRGGTVVNLVMHITHPGASADEIANAVSWKLKTAAV